MTRPGPLMWLRYALTGSLPPRYADWVLHDVTASTWFIRHISRVLALIAVPEVIVIVAIPASGTLKALTAFVTGACVVLLMSILASDSVERNAQRTGLPWGTAERLRAERSVQSQRDHAAAYRAKLAQRGR